jgi:phosphatidate cytidylyltransferase
MSYLDPLGGHTSRNDWSRRDDDGPDEGSRPRYTGAASDSYVGDRPVDLGDIREPYARGGSGPDPYAPDPYAPDPYAPDPYAPDPYAPDPYAPDPYAPDPYAAFREAPDAPVTPVDDGADAYARRSDGLGAPAWDSPTAITRTAASPTSEPDFGLVADRDRQRGPGRRRAGRRTSRSDSTGTPGGDAAPRAGRAGRNLGAAIAVGCGLGAVVLATLFVWPSTFLAVIAAAAAAGIWEMARAIRLGGAHPPLVPLLAGGALMIGLAWYAGPDGLTLGLLATVLAALLWRVANGAAAVRRDLTATVLIAGYVPFLLGFGVLLVEPGDGSFRVLATLLAVVLSDTGGYAAGVFFGKHPMAPSISPKKSWEGFAGSVAAAAIGSAVLLSFALDEPVPVYYGALFGVLIAIVAVLGDLTESMMKRDLGIKDMSRLLPGHGGVMDRLDSIVFAVPAAYLLLSLLAPPG